MQRQYSLLIACLLCGAVLCGLTNSTSAQDAAATPGSQADPPPRAAALDWSTDYDTARQRARQQNKMLLIYFFAEPSTDAQRRFEDVTLHDAAVVELCQNYVLLRTPRDTAITIDGRSVPLLKHAAFQAMNGRAGLAIVDFQNKHQPYYEHTVSCLPFQGSVYYAPRYESTRSVRALLGLPPGTITQRTMVYAVRVHPELPDSTGGLPHPELFTACSNHSQHQARIRLQGHHNWDRRFQNIWQRLGGKPPVEVCAESWPNKDLLAACIDCVHSWRQSPGHWNAVRSSQPAFGYDIRLGSNGIWYATGVFGGS